MPRTVHKKWVTSAACFNWSHSGQIGLNKCWRCGACCPKWAIGSTLAESLQTEQKSNAVWHFMQARCPQLVNIAKLWSFSSQRQTSQKILIMSFDCAMRSRSGSRPPLIYPLGLFNLSPLLHFQHHIFFLPNFCTAGPWQFSSWQSFIAPTLIYRSCLALAYFIHNKQVFM